MNTARIDLAAACLGLLVFASGTAQCQSSFQKLQERLGGAVGPPASPASSPAGLSGTAPGPGYLGGEFDDPRPPQKGVVVNNVKPGAPAEAGGLKAANGSHRDTRRAAGDSCRPFRCRHTSGHGYEPSDPDAARCHTNSALAHRSRSGAGTWQPRSWRRAAGNGRRVLAAFVVSTDGGNGACGAPELAGGATFSGRFRSTRPAVGFKFVARGERARRINSRSV
jgi:hypothetical protein